MLKDIFKFLFVFSLLSANSLTAKEVKLIVDEKIGEATRLRIISFEDQMVEVLLTAKDLNASKSFLNSIELFCFENGINCKSSRNNFYQQFAFTFSTASLELLLKFLKENQNHLEASSDIDLLILGNVNQQKILGSLYSQWSKFRVLNPKNSYSNILNFNSDDLKDTQQYWTKVFAQMLLCETNEFNEKDFELNETALYCNYKAATKTLSPGNIANLKSNMYSKLLVNKENSKSLLRWLQKFRVSNSLETFDEFVALLPSLSIESIHSLYLEYVSLIPAIDTMPYENKVSELTPITVNNITQITPTDNVIWGITLILDEQLNVCGLLNCNNIEQQSVVEYFYSDKTWIFINFHKDDAEKQINTIAEEVLKPLSISNVFSKFNSRVIAFVADDSSILSPLARAMVGASTTNSLDISKSITPQNVNKNSSNGCNEATAIGAPYWANEVLLNYYDQYSEVKQDTNKVFEEWNFKDVFCKASTENLPALNKDTFELLKQALISSIKAKDTNDYTYRSFAIYYQFDINNLLLRQLEQLTFEEFQFYANEIYAH